MTQTPVTEDDLHAYVDGFLDPDRRAQVESWLADNPEAAAMVADWQRQNDDIRGLFGEKAEPRADDAAFVRSRAAPVPTLPGRTHRTFWQVAAAIAVFVSGTLAGQLAPPLLIAEKPASVQMTTASLPDQAQSAFLIYASDIRHPVEVAASEEAHLVAWLGKRLDYPLNAPDLSRTGFHLVGGRLVPVNGKAGALLMYEDDSGQRITVLIGRNEENRETSFRYASADGVETFYWIDGPVGYAVSGEIPRERLQLIADECYRQFPT